MGVTVPQFIGRIAIAVPVEEVEGGDVISEGGRVNSVALPPEVTVVTALCPLVFEASVEDDGASEDEMMPVAVCFVEPPLLEVAKSLIDAFPERLAPELLALPLVEPESDGNPLPVLKGKMMPLDDEFPRINVLNVVGPLLIDILPRELTEEPPTLLLKTVQWS